MRPDSKRITTQELADGTVVIAADLSWLPQERALNRPGPEELKRNGSRVELLVNPDTTLAFRGISAPEHIGFSARRARRRPRSPMKRRWQTVGTPLDPLVEGTLVQRRAGELESVAQRRWTIGRNIEYERVRKIWNGLLRRALDVVDPDVIRLNNAIGGSLDTYNVLAKHPHVERLVRESRAFGVCLTHASKAQLHRIRSHERVTLTEAFEALDLFPTPTFLHYARHAHFTQRFAPGVNVQRYGRRRLAMSMYQLVSDLELSWIQKLRTADQWAFLHALASAHLRITDEERARLVYCYLGGDPQAMLDAVDGYYSRDRQLGWRTLTRQAALCEMLLVPCDTLDIPRWAELSKAHAIYSILTNTVTTPEDLLF